MINQRIQTLQQIMKEKNIDFYYICMGDYHNSEFIHPFFKTIEYLTGFTGSAGQVVVEQNHIILWSDGRYYIQAKNQIKDTCIEFYQLEDPTPVEYIQSKIKEGQTIAFDGHIVSYTTGKNLASLNSQVQDMDLISEIWKERIPLPKDPIFILDTKYTGQTIEEKLFNIKKRMEEAGANCHILTVLDDIAWTLNLRGYDAISDPVFLSYFLIENQSYTLYIDACKLNEEVIQYLKKHHICIKEYNEIYTDVQTLKGTVLVDPRNVNYSLIGNTNCSLIFKDNPTELLKSIKNSIEIENLRQCHLMDSVAFTKFIYWAKKNVGKIKIDEYSAALQLKEFRKQLEGYIEVGYGCICAYNENAAMMHYQATSNKKAELYPEGILLVDSGGQYVNGTTDYTRTFALGEVKQEWKVDFSTVLISHAQLAQANFLEGCSGMTLDILARQPIWQRNLDYQCGTGHGLGFCLGVHEGPQGIRWYQSLKRKEGTPLQEGMVVTNEPGIYIENSHGIRTENVMVVQKGIKNEYGQFLHFETLNFVPIDLDCIDIETLDSRTKAWLNEYHKQTYLKLSPYLDYEEKEWLKENTRAI